MKFYTEVHQGPFNITVDIKIEDSPFAGFVSAVKVIDVFEMKPTPAVVVFNIRWRTVEPDYINVITRWLDCAKDVALQFDRMFKSREDFGRPVTVRQVAAPGFYLLVDFVEEVEKL